MRFFNVSYMLTQNDNGSCLTFWTMQEAERCAADFRSQGAYHVRVWAC